MKKGEHLRCPICGEDTIVKQESVLDGWEKVGEKYVCALCGGTLGTAEETASQAEGTSNAAARLQSLLGGETVEKPKISLSGEDRRFCKDCKYSVRNAFQIRCSITDSPVDPMDDCPHFEHR